MQYQCMPQMVIAEGAINRSLVPCNYIASRRRNRSLQHGAHIMLLRGIVAAQATMRLAVKAYSCSLTDWLRILAEDVRQYTVRFACAFVRAVEHCAISADSAIPNDVTFVGSCRKKFGMVYILAHV